MLVKREALRALIESADNKPYEVDFIKSDGSKRHMRAQQGVKHNLKGGVNTVEREDRPYLVTFDVDKEEYRTINLSTVFHLKIDDVDYEVED